MSSNIKKTQPAKFFLKGMEPSNDTSFLAPPRKGMVIEPLVDGVTAFRSMEEAIDSAKKSVYLAFWIFNPNTPIQSRKVKKNGKRHWADLLRSAANRGVDVRVLLTDFDPLFQDNLHRYNWNAYRRLVHEANRLDVDKRDNLQTICSLHPATASIGIESRLEHQLKKHVTFLNQRLKDSGERATLRFFSNWPGLWRLVKYYKQKKTFLLRENVELVAYPASHHQKLCIVDEITSFCGGLDINIGRIATPSHNSERNFWHDVDVKMQGAASLDVCRNFIGRWNVEVPLFLKGVKSANNSFPPYKMALSPVKPDLYLKTTIAPALGKAIVQIHRTKSDNTFFSPVPSTIQDDIKKGYERAITHAKHYIYIENQYVRSPELGEWIIDRAKTNPDLRVIIVLPIAPEEVGATGTGDELTEHGLSMQHEVLIKLRRELKERVGIFSLIMKVKGRGRSKTETFGSPQIYLHSKLLIIDDLYANIGSSNTNPRSFYVDTEITAACYCPDEVKRLRLKLWQEHLGRPKGMENWVAVNFVSKWTKIAEANAKTAIVKRQGFVIPHDEARFPGTKASILPDKFAQVFDIDNLM